MTFREFNIAITRDPILGKLLPMQLRRTFPWLSVKEKNLCASFVGFRIVREGETVKAFDPAYYLKVTYPKCTLQSFEKLSLSSNSRIMKPHASEEIKALAELCDTVLQLWNEKSADMELEQALSVYNSMLKTILEPEQAAVLEKFVDL